MKRFNTTAACIPEENYMVDISGRIRKIEALVADKDYFTINRARQYGKTTTLNAVREALKDVYYVISMDFEDYSADTFENEDTFCRDFSRGFCTALEECAGDNRDIFEDNIRNLRNMAERSEKNEQKMRLFPLFQELKTFWDCADRPLVLIIDEVDSAANNQVFMDFLAQLRAHYQKRKRLRTYKTFQSVILAGVTDVKHLKARIRKDSEEKENSPWNIAVDFKIDMSFSEEDIKGMLDDYENDHHTGMGELPQTIKVCGFC